MLAAASAGPSRLALEGQPQLQPAGSCMIGRAAILAVAEKLGWTCYLRPWLGGPVSGYGEQCLFLEYGGCLVDRTKLTNELRGSLADAQLGSEEQALHL